MVGSTGTGKTAVAAMAAAKLSGNSADTTVSVCRVSAPSYMPCGSVNRSTKETIAVIAEHVARHKKTLLVIDEIDKIHALENTWLGYIRAEIFELLDGRWPTGLVMPEIVGKPDITIDELTTKLRNSVFILSIGTFQSWLDSANTRRSMGFGAEIDSGTDIISAEIIAEKMPRELANRHNSSLIRIPELRKEDYLNIATEAENKLPLRMQAAFRAEVSIRITEAISAKKGVRFLEEAMMATLIQLPPEPAINPFATITIDDLEQCTL